MTRQIKAGTTSVSIVVRVVDDSDGTPETGVIDTTTGADFWYRREGATKTTFSLAALASLSTAWASGGWEEIDDGYYRLDIPDAACASGVTGVQVGGSFTGMIVMGEYIELVAYDPYDATRLGLTALPNADADAAGGLPISDAGGLDLDTLDSNVSAVLTDTSTTLDNLVDDLETRLGTPSDLGSGATIAANMVDIEAQTDDIGAAGAGLTAVPWNANWDAEVQSEVQDAIEANHLDHLMASATSLTTDIITASSLKTDAVNEIADGILDRDMSTGTDSGSSTVRTPRQALRLLRNRWTSSAGSLTVYKEDDSTTSWTGTLTTDSGADPITENNPAGGS